MVHSAIVVAPTLSDRHASTTISWSNIPRLCSIHRITLRGDPTTAKTVGGEMLKIRFEYDLPVYDSAKHDPDKVFRLLTYRGVTYAKMVYLKSRGKSSWNVKQ